MHGRHDVNLRFRVIRQLDGAWGRSCSRSNATRVMRCGMAVDYRVIVTEMCGLKFVPLEHRAEIELPIIEYPTSTDARLIDTVDHVSGVGQAIGRDPRYLILHVERQRKLILH